MAVTLTERVICVMAAFRKAPAATAVTGRPSWVSGTVTEVPVTVPMPVTV